MFQVDSCLVNTCISRSLLVVAVSCCWFPTEWTDREKPNLCSLTNQFYVQLFVFLLLLLLLFVVVVVVIDVLFDCRFVIFPSPCVPTERQKTNPCCVQLWSVACILNLCWIVFVCLCACLFILCDSLNAMHCNAMQWIWTVRQKPKPPLCPTIDCFHCPQLKNYTYIVLFILQL